MEKFSIPLSSERDSSLYKIRPELEKICSNQVRACILHLLLKNKERGHCMSVEEIAFKLGKRHSVIIHHLEKLSKWNLVQVVKCEKYGSKQKRSLWGLNLSSPDVVKEVYAYILKYFYNMNELDRMCSMNKNVRA